jgi:hypothetical protein
MVLAEFATKIASETARRQNERTGVELRKRLFFDRIQCQRRNSPVRKRVENSFDILPNTAPAKRTLVNFAPVGAQEAAHPIAPAAQRFLQQSLAVFLIRNPVHVYLVTLKRSIEYGAD